ncbi:hypothetical protein, partial [Thermoflexus sp.]|uniref:hypothetical protein n=1 Tax=Thermoflexus sp. TaxID=1969742 RepID=UPI003C08F109
MIQKQGRRVRPPSSRVGHSAGGPRGSSRETPGGGERLKKVLALLLRDLERFELDKKIAARVKEQMDQNQREYYLR